MTPQQELAESRAASREAALADRWAEILAGLPSVEPEHFERLARRCFPLAVENLRRHPDLLEAVEDRLDTIWEEFHKEATA